ncbi:hypothetical protein ACFOQM_09160 [Paenibacillus sp. GCM10012307]|uniref:Uncharacterized protein n=1 Tax=Paenibacillus roseus TaxID=2798579 RepID=A0A934J195_9BACL|nr:hypothetical protein [Paenibacillus roseus]MBJ6361454.1 hypothetical protein [Paenibacillus roseus]
MKKKHIYILLSDTGTWFTRMIKLYTKAEHNHASIAFDDEFKEVYSFGRKRPGNPFVGGFVKEDLQSEFFSKASCAVFSCKVSERKYNQLRAYVRKFEQEPHRYKYNLLGVLGIMMKIRVKRENAFFCSQFVATVFEQNGHSLVPKCASLTTPADLERSNALQLMYRGEIQHIMQSSCQVL